MTPRYLLRVAVLALVAASVLAACSNGTGIAAHPPAASVDGAKITDAEVASNVKIFTFLAGLNSAPCGAKVAGETDQAACARFAIGSLIQEHFVTGYAAEHNLTVAQADKDGIVTQLEQSLGGAAAVDAKLKAAGIGRPELQDLAGRILLFQKVQGAVGAEADQAALHAQYEKNILQFTTLDTEHILVQTEAEANDVYDQVTAPGASEQDFLDLAKKVSIDPSAKTNSGAIGATSAAGLDPAYAAAAAALKPGGISKPVQSQFGWHVIRLISKKIQPFAQATATLAEQAFDTWLTSAEAAATITVNPKYGTFNAATGNVDAVTSTATGSATPSAVPTLGQAVTTSPAPAS